ncbi:hypothetical protein ACFTXK_04360 [Streptomyces sp. NPDC056956]|uniref:hypothetical protein n=1 Tax=unclassified Streptomyces TaxID=2593676 RepID=UPI003640E8B3
MTSDVPWSVVDTAPALHTWAQAWDNAQGNADLFHPELLNDSATTVLAGHATDGTVIAGAVASRSDHVVGISNVFARNDDLDTAWPMILNAAHPLPRPPPHRLRTHRRPGSRPPPRLRTDRGAADLAVRICSA